MRCDCFKASIVFIIRVIKESLKMTYNQTATTQWPHTPWQWPLNDHIHPGSDHSMTTYTLAVTTQWPHTPWQWPFNDHIHPGSDHSMTTYTLAVTTQWPHTHTLAVTTQWPHTPWQWPLNDHIHPGSDHSMTTYTLAVTTQWPHTPWQWPLNDHIHPGSDHSMTTYTLAVTTQWPHTPWQWPLSDHIHPGSDHSVTTYTLAVTTQWPHTPWQWPLSDHIHPGSDHSVTTYTLAVTTQWPHTPWQWPLSDHIHPGSDHSVTTYIQAVTILSTWAEGICWQLFWERLTNSRHTNSRKTAKCETPFHMWHRSSRNNKSVRIINSDEPLLPETFIKDFRSRDICQWVTHPILHIGLPAQGHVPQIKQFDVSVVIAGTHTAVMGIVSVTCNNMTNCHLVQSPCHPCSVSLSPIFSLSIFCVQSPCFVIRVQCLCHLFLVYIFMCVYVCVCECVHVCLCICMHACLHVFCVYTSSVCAVCVPNATVQQSLLHSTSPDSIVATGSTFWRGSHTFTAPTEASQHSITHIYVNKLSNDT